MAFMLSPQQLIDAREIMYQRCRRWFSHHDAEDIAGKGLSEILAKPGLPEGTNLEALATTIATRRCIDQIRKNDSQRRNNYKIKPAANSAPWVDPLVRMEQEEAALEKNRRWYNKIQNLEQPLQELIVRKHLCGEKLKDAMEAMGLDPKYYGKYKKQCSCFFASAKKDLAEE
ncbi:sigma-70 family RNA polymerase sigma factor [bacterium AH-315-J04]|nr:sigma-70 family RNA polymerase sigma factor [bacterium AH-315-J04]